MGDDLLRDYAQPAGPDGSIATDASAPTTRTSASAWSAGARATTWRDRLRRTSINSMAA